jgi:hypothetical protein
LLHCRIAGNVANWQLGNPAIRQKIMSSKRPSLAETMQKVARPDAATMRPMELSAPVANAAERPSGFYAATRAGKKKLTTTLDPAAHIQFRQLALELGKNGETLLVEAINDLFRKYGKAPVA